MSDRYDSYPPDEPVIGGSYPPGETYPSTPPVIGATEPYETIGAYAAVETVEYGGDEDTYDEEYGYDEDSYYDDYYDAESPVRQPVFYIFLGVAVLVGGIFIYLLYSLAVGDGGGSGVLPPSQLNVLIDQPVPNERIEVGKDMTVAVRANAAEPIVRFELIIQDRPVDSVNAQPPKGSEPYSASFKWRFNSKGEYTIFVRAITESGATKDSDQVKVVAFEGPGDRPVSINGKVIASVSMRTGPGENFEAVGTLTAGQQVKIVGKTRDSDWLLIDNDGGRWVKRQAIEVLESLALVPIKEPTPVPQATATNTPPASPSPTPSPTVNPTAPDFAPTHASLLNGGATLRVTVANLSTNSYSGPLVVAVGGVSPGTLTKAFNVEIPANGATIVEFELNPPVTTQKSAQVKVDPDNAIKETNEDNNNTTFVLTPPVEQPEIVISGVSFGATTIDVTIKNEGGPLAASTVTVKVTVGGASAQKVEQIALATGQSYPFTVPRPGTGSAVIEVLVNGTVVTTQNLNIE
jgi:uncharacterized protein YgiM (DUF1202 family)